MLRLLADENFNNIGQVVEDLLIMVECSSVEDWDTQVQYLPL